MPITAPRVSADLSGKILPELTQKLVTLPKFKGQRIAVIADSQGVPGGMQSALQKQLVSALLKVDGITLMNGSFPELAGITMEDCFNWQNADIVLVLSEKRDQSNIRFSIRALDPQDKSRYLSGISYDLDYALENDLNYRLSDAPARLTGTQSTAALRETVFDAADQAPLADRLAADLYCGLMKRNQLPLVLHAQVATADNALPLTRALSLRLLQRLGDLQQVRLSHSAPQVAASLALELTPGTADSVNRVTATLKAADGQLLLASASVRLPATQASATAVATVPPVPEPHSQPIRPAAPPASPAQATVPVQVQVAEPAPPRAKILQFDVVIPTDLTHCVGTNPWRSGERTLRAGEALPTGGCFALSLVSVPDTTSVILYKDTDDTLMQLVPAGCGPTLRKQAQPDRLQLRFPDPASDYPAIDLGRETGTEGFYVITAGAEYQSTLQALVQDLPTLCTRPAGQNNPAAQQAVAVADFNQRLQALKNQLPQQLDWRYREFEHR